MDNSPAAATVSTSALSNLFVSKSCSLVNLTPVPLISFNAWLASNNPFVVANMSPEVAEDIANSFLKLLDSSLLIAKFLDMSLVWLLTSITEAITAANIAGPKASFAAAPIVLKAAPIVLSPFWAANCMLFNNSSPNPNSPIKGMSLIPLRILSNIPILLLILSLSFPSFSNPACIPFKVPNFWARFSASDLANSSPSMAKSFKRSTSALTSFSNDVVFLILAFIASFPLTISLVLSKFSPINWFVSLWRLRTSLERSTDSVFVPTISLRALNWSCKIALIDISDCSTFFWLSKSSFEYLFSSMFWLSYSSINMKKTKTSYDVFD